MAKKRITPSESFTVTETKRGKPHWTQEGQDASIKAKFQRKSDAYHKNFKIQKQFLPKTSKMLIDRLSGGEERKPHSSKEGREAAAGRKFRRIVEKGYERRGKKK